VDDHFAQVRFTGKPRKVAKYAKWAIRTDGPMVWQTPTPADCTVNSVSPGYIVCPLFYDLQPLSNELIQKPENIFESTFMVALLTPFVKSFQGSCHNYGYPKGALALGAAAVRFLLCFFISNNKPATRQLHRAFSMYTTGIRLEARQFSRENVGEIVAVFGANSQRLTNRRWTQILASYGVECDGKKKATGDYLLDEQQFRNLYVPSSSP
jgi:hypothetical protein